MTTFLFSMNWLVSTSRRSLVMNAAHGLAKSLVDGTYTHIHILM